MEKTVKVYLVICLILIVGVFLYASGMGEGKQEAYEEYEEIIRALEY